MTSLVTIIKRLPSGLALGTLCGVLLITGAMATQERPATVGSLPDPPGHFDREGWGVAAPVQDAWRIELAGPEPMTMVPSAVRCDSDLYLIDTSGGIIHHVTLDAERRLDVIGVALDGTHELKWPHTAAVDCDAERLYVVDADGVKVFNTRSKQVESRFQHPPLFAATSLSGAILNAQQRTLYVPGLWSRRRRAWLIHGRDAMFSGASFGYVLNVENGSISRGLPAVDRGCWSWTWDCASVTDDRGSDGVWVAAHRVGTDVAVFSDDGRLIRRFDARSDLFRRDGTRLLVSSTTREKFAWHHRNSVIARVYRFEGIVATIHLYHSTERPFSRLPNYEVFMNLHRLDGTGVASDMKLPGLPLFRDDRSLYIVDYGPGGRAPTGFGPLTIVSVPILAPDGSLNAALRDPRAVQAEALSENR